jgi:hypothetical protein
VFRLRIQLNLRTGPCQILLTSVLELRADRQGKRS